MYFSKSSGAGGGVFCNEACKITRILACIISLKIYIFKEQ